MNENTGCTEISESVISSKLHTEAIFTVPTVESIERILIDGTKRFIPDPKTGFSKASNSTVKNFSEYIAEQLNKIPNFLHSKISFESQPNSNKKASLFGEGYHSTFTGIMVISVNSSMSPTTWKDAWANKFDLEIKRLRSVVRHELAHRLHLEKAQVDPVKRMKSRQYKKLMTPYRKAHSYYGMPTEILAHANHTVELMNLGHDRAWRETLAQFALTDDSSNFKNTRRFVSLVISLMKEYNVPWLKRLAFKKELIKLAKQMRASVKDLGVDQIDTSLETAIGSVSPEHTKSARFISQYSEG